MKIVSLAMALFYMVVMSSCGNTKKIQYLQGSIDLAKYGKVNYNEPVIQVGDQLGITVFSKSAEASSLYNQPIVGGTTAATVAGYTVDNNGNIMFQSLGNVTAKGLTRQQLGAAIAKKLDSVLTEPYCQVKFLNYKITVIGEVNRPSVYTVPSEKVSVLEAIGLAGDLTTFGRRDSILVIRETDVERKFGWIDIRQPEIFNSDYFYLQQNDVIVVHPTRAKAAAANDQVWVRNVTLAATLLSSLAVVYSLLTR
jgi:polysaccharide biosynthesis/export protein